MFKTQVKMVARPSIERGHADHGWLKTFHSFSFASYSSMHNQFGSLRVLNEDRVAPQTGFGAHSHREFEIFSYVVEGELGHQDSMGNVEVLKRGEIQMTSAGTGIQHSEKCHGPNEVHFLQIWASPSKRGLQPSYYTRTFSDSAKENKWAHIVAPVTTPGISLDREANGPTPINATLDVYASIISPLTKTAYLTRTLSPSTNNKSGDSDSDDSESDHKDLPAKRDKVYVHVVQRSGYNTGASSGTKVKISVDDSSLVLQEGDGVYITGTAGKHVAVENVHESIPAEVLLFDVE